MILNECIFIDNDCYKKHVKMTRAPAGIVVHSTGCNNFFLKRYVQPVKSQSYYDAVIKDLGKNPNGNDWNRSGVKKCVHGFIGYNSRGVIETYQTLPFDLCCWGCGSGSKGSYNNNPDAYIQFEICETDLTNKEYFNAAMREAIEFCAYLVDRFGISINNVVSHAEAHGRGYASNHGDINHWLAIYGKDMHWFRMEVSKILNKEKTRYAVQVGSFASKENADKCLTDLKKAGFSGYIIRKE